MISSLVFVDLVFCSFVVVVVVPGSEEIEVAVCFLGEDFGIAIGVVTGEPDNRFSATRNGEFP